MKTLCKSLSSTLPKNFGFITLPSHTRMFRYITHYKIDDMTDVQYCWYLADNTYYMYNYNDINYFLCLRIEDYSFSIIKA